MKAPDVPGLFTIVASPNESSELLIYQTKQIDIQVIIPFAIRMRNGVDISGYLPGHAGVGFIADVHLLPKSVSFAEIETMEGDAPPITTGWFDRPSKRRKHKAGTWVVTDERNQAGQDKASFDPPGYPPDKGSGRYRFGTHQWIIPYYYQPADGFGVPRPLLTLEQLFVMTGSSGQMVVYKGGWAAVRTP